MCKFRFSYCVLNIQIRYAQIPLKIGPRSTKKLHTEVLSNENKNVVHKNLMGYLTGHTTVSNNI